MQPRPSCETDGPVVPRVRFCMAAAILQASTGVVQHMVACSTYWNRGLPVVNGGAMAEEAGPGSLPGKIAVVTGGTSGSGKAIVKRFAAEGATLFVLARGSDRLRQLAEDVEGDITG